MCQLPAEPSPLTRADSPCLWVEPAEPVGPPWWEWTKSPPQWCSFSFSWKFKVKKIMVWFQGSRCEWQVILAIITEGSKDLWEWRMVLGALYPGSLQKREKGHPRTPDGPVMEWSSQGARQLQCGLGSWCPIPQRLWNPSPVTSSWPSLQASEGASSELFSPTFTSDKLESLQLKFPRNNGCIL